MSKSGLLEGKKGIVFGLANSRSYAWYISSALIEAGASCGFAYLPGENNERRVRGALCELVQDKPWVFPCDVSSDEDLDRLFDQVEVDFGTIDFIIHSVAFANKEYLRPGSFHKTPREVWQQSLDISAYSLIGISQRACRIIGQDGGSIVSMSYIGGEKVVPGYNIMGVAKAALETTSRYLALELGQMHIRVNCISGGPLRTLSSMSVGNFDKMLAHQEKFSPLGRNISGQEVGAAARFLVSDAATAITGEVIHVDGGFSHLACFPSE